MTYTPTTEEVRSMYGSPLYAPEFDRWLAAHDAEVRAQALNEAIASLRAMFGPTTGLPTISPAPSKPRRADE